MKKIVYCLLALVAMATVGCEHNNGNEPIIVPDNGQMIQTPTDALDGVFTVSPDGRKSRFSHGFLQFNTSNGEFQFAKAQWEIVGTANMKDKELGAVIDLFAWSGSDTKSFGISLKNDPMFYAGKFIDWGENKIGNNTPGVWRTMDHEEWTYLLKNHKHQWAKVNGIEGLFILPDNLTEDAKNADLTKMCDLSLDDWKKIEDAWDAVFIPVNYYREGYDLKSPNGVRMWTSTPMKKNDKTGVCEGVMFYISSMSSEVINCPLPVAMPVRLVTDNLDIATPKL